MLRYVQRSGDRSWFERPEGMSPVLHRLLIQRGISSAEQAERFLHPSIDHLNDPFLLNDMDLAADRIRRAMDSNQRICIYGDYDVDGVCASAILYDYFLSEGIEAEVYLPSRHEEGYGLNESAVRAIAQRADLLVTVDCGIASRDLVALAMELGLDCIVTDHHRPGELVPQCPVVNPLLGDYPFPWLCGAGVAFKLVHALGGMEAALERIDLAAIATVADVVSLTDENRAIVHLGLQRINANARPGVAALMESARVEPGQVTSETIGFRIAPRLNAGGRLGSARRSWELLVQQEPFLAIAQADELEQENTRRQTIEKEIRAGAKQQLQDFDFSAHRIIMVRGEGWNPGVIGLTASHLKEEYHCPAIVFSENEGVLTGSCRSIEGVDIYETLASAPHLIERFGGHKQAAGLTILAENFDELQAALDRYLFENVPSRVYVPWMDYDIEASLDECGEAFVRELAALEPTGCGNPEPVFRTAAQVIEARAIGAQGSHLRLILGENGARRTGIFFGAGERAGRLGETAEILFTPQLNVWNGRTDVQVRLHALRENDAFAQFDAAKPAECEKQRRFLTELFYNRTYNFGYTPRTVTMRELKKMLDENIQGTWVLCAGLDAAAAVRRETLPCPMDISIGDVPADERAFNTLLVYPQDMSSLPRALRRLVLVGVPAMGPLPEGVELFSLDMQEPLWQELPDVSAMREVYRAMLYLTRRPAHIPDWEALDARLAEETGQSATSCHASVLALLDMKLVELRAKPFAFRLPPMKKTDPDSSAVWRAIQTVKNYAEGRNSHDR